MSADITTPTVALLGTGTMGAGMARNILAAGLPLRVWNRTPAKAEPLAEAGAKVAADAREAVAGADVIVTMLYDEQSVADCIESVEATEGTVWIQSSTVGVEGAERLGRLAADRGLVYVDAPVLGTRKPAEDGTLTVLASGPDEAAERCAPVFDAIGVRTLWLGTAGAGSRLKLAANLWVGTIIEGVSEALALATGLGVDPQQLLDVLKGGPLDAPYVQLKGAAMLAGEFSPAAFRLAGAAKDFGLITEAARNAGLDLAVAEAIARRFAHGVDAGHGDLDMSALFLTAKP
jgi:3-hydroxyisobutyrate dehydrogenase